MMYIGSPFPTTAELGYIKLAEYQENIITKLRAENAELRKVVNNLQPSPGNYDAAINALKENQSWWPPMPQKSIQGDFDGTDGY